MANGFKVMILKARIDGVQKGRLLISCSFELQYGENFGAHSFGLLREFKV